MGRVAVWWVEDEVAVAVEGGGGVVGLGELLGGCEFSVYITTLRNGEMDRIME